MGGYLSQTTKEEITKEEITNEEITKEQEEFNVITTEIVDIMIITKGEMDDQEWNTFKSRIANAFCHAPFKTDQEMYDVIKNLDTKDETIGISMMNVLDDYFR